MKPRRPVRCRQSRRARAFSLLEVVFAVAVLAAGVLGAAALMTPMLRAARETSERRAARQVLIASERELRTLAVRAPGGFDSFAAGAMAGLQFVADRDGRQFEAAATTALPPDAQFFRIEVVSASAPAWRSGQGFVVLVVQVSWPYGGGRVRTEDRWSQVAPLVLSP